MVRSRLLKYSQRIAILPALLGGWTGSAQLAAAQSNSSSLCVVNNQPTGGPQECIPLSDLAIARRSLTVIGQGQVSAPADTALLEFRFGTQSQLSGDQPDSLQLARRVSDQALKPTLQALAKAGVSDRAITVQANPLQNPSLRVQIERPTQERVQEIVLTVERSLQSNRDVFLQSIGAAYTLRNCQPLAESARRIALRDAQSQVRSLAREVGVGLGELMHVTVMPFIGAPSTTACGTKVGVPDTSPFALSIEETAPPYNPSDKPEVQVRSQVSITHAIQETGRNHDRPH